MLDFSVTFLITVVNVTFLYVVLRKILFKPVTKFMEDRSARIQKDLDSAKNTVARAEALESEYSEKLKASREEGMKIIQAARDKARQEHDEIVAEAKAEAERIVATTRAAIEEERRTATVALRRETADLTIRAATKVVRENLDSERNRKLVESFLETAGVS